MNFEASPPPEFHWIESAPRRFEIAAKNIPRGRSADDATLIQVGLWVRRDDTVLSPTRDENMITCLHRFLLFLADLLRLTNRRERDCGCSRESRFLFCDMSNSKWHYRCDHTCSLFRDCDGGLLFRDQTWRRASYEVKFDSSRCNVPSRRPYMWITLWLVITLCCYGCHNQKALADYFCFIFLCRVLPPALLHIFIYIL